MKGPKGGTLFLDEVNSLSPAAQTRLLRVIQEGEMERVGGKQTIYVDLRIISATNVNLLQTVKQGLFRNDLYYRINVVKLEIPPLVERPEDLLALVHLILQRMSKKHNKTIETVSRGVMQQIRAYSWPGNVRELENTLERSLLFSTGSEITELKLDIDESSSNALTLDWKQQKEKAVESVEKTFLKTALEQHQGDIKKVAELMEISTRAVYSKLTKYQVNAHDYRK